MSDVVVHVEAPSRLHFGLFSFGQSHLRQFGGVGAMLNEPGLKLSVSARPDSSDVVTSDPDGWQATGPHAERALAFAREWRAANDASSLPPLRLEIQSAPPEHVGLGTGTQLALAVAAALHAFQDPNWTLPDSSDLGSMEPARLAGGVGRGKRSSIGSHGFAWGGLLVESGKRHATEISPLTCRTNLPDAWRFVLARPLREQGLSGDGERRAFGGLPPVPVETTAELCREALTGLLPAARVGGFAEFSGSLYRFGQLAGKCFAAAQGGTFA
ncbi:MAG: hypothetical protein N2C14_19465, partial [Planctomycetales bacterium]